MMTQQKQLLGKDWTLRASHFKDSIFHKINMKEYVDISKVLGFIKDNMGISYKGIDRYSGVSKLYSTEYQQITKYRDLYNSQGDNFTVSYSLPKHKWGRINPKGYLSLCVFHRPTRHSLCDGKYKDIDMENACPRVIDYVAKINGTVIPELRKYIKKAKEFRNEIMTHHGVSKDIAKQLPITIMNGGSYSGWLEDNAITNEKIEWIVDLEQQLQPVITLIYEFNKKGICGAVEKHNPSKWANDGERRRGCMALFYQTIERTLQETAIRFLVENKGFRLEEIVPCQDGFMIKEELFYPEIMDDCSNVLLNTFSIEMKFVNKDFDEKIDIKPYTDMKDIDEWHDYLSSKLLAKKCIELFGKNLIFENGILFVYRDEKWAREENKDKQYKLDQYISEELYNHIFNEINQSIMLSYDNSTFLKKQLRKMTSTNTNVNDIKKYIFPEIKNQTSIFDMNPFLLGFNNGVIDLPTGEFRNNKYDDYITMSCSYDYVKPVEDEAFKKNKQELETIFENIIPNQQEREYLFKVLASGLDGLLYQRMYLFNGLGGNGKGLTQGLMNALLGEYFLVPNNGILKDVEKSNSASPDLAMLYKKRYVNFKEVGGNIRTPALRNLVGGGDMVARYLYSSCFKFQMTSTTVMEFNNPPKLEGKPMPSDYRRLYHLRFPNQFTNDENKIGKTINGVNYLKGNSKYESNKWFKEVRPVFLESLLAVYQKNYSEEIGLEITVPQSIRDRSNEWLKNQNVFQSVFDENFESTEDESNIIKFVDIWQCITSSLQYKQLLASEKMEYTRATCYSWLKENFEEITKSKVMYITKFKYFNQETEDLKQVDEKCHITESQPIKINKQLEIKEKEL